MPTWIDVCPIDEIDDEDVMPWDHAGHHYAIYRAPDDQFYATDGLCTHEHVKLAGGLVTDHIIACPKHNGQFDYRTGQAKGAPACINLKTYPTRVQGDRVQIALD